jgi:predicted metal-dependent hydrolase
VALSLPVRNRLAELILDAFDDVEARATLDALARAAAAPPAALEPGDGSRLERLGWFERPPDGGLRLRGAHRADRGALAARAGRAARQLRAWRDDPAASALDRLLARAAALARAGLFFEVHELLEPAWLRAGEPLRTALQGLIQVAVALHHLEQGNRAGARSLLHEGSTKLAAAGSALPLDTSGWLTRLGALHEALERGREPPDLPPWPSPRGWRAA